MIFLRRLRQRLDQRAVDAEAEVAESGRRLEETRANVLTPLERMAKDNNFAAIIRDSIIAGHGSGGKGV